VVTADFHPHILEKHVEELETLWNRRLRADRSASVTVSALGRLDRWIEAHTDAIAIAGRHTAPLIALLGSLSGPPAAAAAFIIGHSDAPSLVQLLAPLLAAAEPRQRLGMIRALELRAGKGTLDALDAIATLSTDAESTAGALAVLAAHGDRRAAAAQLELLLTGGAAAARMLAWRSVRRLGQDYPLASSHYEQGSADADATVQRAALEASVAARQPFLLAELRRAAAAPAIGSLERHLFFAVLAGAADAPSVLALASAKVLGWERYRILCAYGRAPAVEVLIESMRAGNPLEGALAAAAFRRITGVDVAGQERVPLVRDAAEPDPFADLSQVCDVARAERAWRELREPMGGSRWAHGVDTDATPPEALPGAVDLESRWAAELRATFTSTSRRSSFFYESFARG
jgi:hypothetical protein